MSWYYAEGGQQKGPVSDQDFEALVQAGSVRDDRSTQISRMGGSAETLVTAFVVSPRGVPSGSSVVTMATPVGNALMMAK